jgi:hypothetical protein
LVLWQIGPPICAPTLEESFLTLIIGELSLFRRLFISSFARANPLTWWRMHESQFLNVGFLAKQNFKISSSQIESEHVFSFVAVLMALGHCHLQVDNMDWIIIIVKN